MLEAQRILSLFWKSLIFPRKSDTLDLDIQMFNFQKFTWIISLNLFYLIGFSSLQIFIVCVLPVLCPFYRAIIALILLKFILMNNYLAYFLRPILQVSQCFFQSCLIFFVFPFWMIISLMSSFVSSISILASINSCYIIICCCVMFSCAFRCLLYAGWLFCYIFFEWIASYIFHNFPFFSWQRGSFVIVYYTALYLLFIMGDFCAFFRGNMWKCTKTAFGKWLKWRFRNRSNSRGRNRRWKF